jgi:hypothetical protein
VEAAESTTGQHCSRQTISHRLEQPEVRRFYVTMLLERNAPGDQARARELLSEAVPMYSELGMAKHLELRKPSSGYVGQFRYTEPLT